MSLQFFGSSSGHQVFCRSSSMLLRRLSNKLCKNQMLFSALTGISQSVKNFTRMLRAVKSSSQTDTRYACSLGASYSHKHKEQNPTEFDVRKLPGSRILHFCNTNAQANAHRCQWCNNRDNVWLKDWEAWFLFPHEEADILITQFTISMSTRDECVHVVCDDTDVFVLIVHF